MYICRYVCISIIDKADKLTLSLCNPICEGLSSVQVQCPAENGSGPGPARETSEHGDWRGEVISRENRERDV